MLKKWEGFEKGINLGGWLSQCNHTKERYDNFITEEDFKELSTWNIDHIRVPVDYDLVETEEGQYKEEGFKYIEKAIAWSKKYHLNMILDLHKTFGFSFDAGEKEDGFFENEQYQERFYKLWEEFAKRFADNEEMLAFELLNEVTEKEYGPIWNGIAEKCVKRIRAIAPTIKILFGGYWNNSVNAVKDLAMPFDENIVYNFHCYDPLLFTHQGAYWVEGMPLDYRYDFDHTVEELKAETEKVVPYGLICFDKTEHSEEKLGPQFFMDIFAEPVKVAEERDVMLYCGEYGVIEHVSSKNALAWYQAIHEAFEKCGIGRAAWSYKEMDFGLSDDNRKDIIKKLPF